VLEALDALDATCFFSLVWKFDKGFTSESYKWAFRNVLQRLSITMERQVQKRMGVWYPALDVVVDWFPQPNKCREYFQIYDEAFRKGYTFEKNRIKPLSSWGACPCLLVTSCQFSPALQLVDYCVGAMGDLLRWAYRHDTDGRRLADQIKPVTGRLLADGQKVIGYGLVLPTKGQARAKVGSALKELQTRHGLRIGLPLPAARPDPSV
jgi:hypothetical protein